MNEESPAFRRGSVNGPGDDEPVDMTAVLLDDLILDAFAKGLLELAVELSDGDPVIRLLAGWVGSTR